jgi:hypothetical protein
MENGIFHARLVARLADVAASDGSSHGTPTLHNTSQEVVRAPVTVSEHP